jgi:hypothetical protein
MCVQVRERLLLALSSTGLEPENDCAGEVSSKCKLQTSPLVRKGTRHQQTHSCLKMIEKIRKIGRWSQMGARHQDRLTN